MSARSWKFYYKKNDENSIRKDWTETIFLWLAIGLFWLSFFAIITECYPVLKPDMVMYPVLIVYLVLLWYVYEIVFPKLKGKKRWLRLLAPVVNVVAFALFFRAKRDEVTTGILAVAQTYLGDYNFYYKTTYSVAGGNAAYIAIAFSFVAFIWWMLLWNLAYGLKKRWILIAFPLTAFFLELSVGKSPKENGIVYLFIGAIFIFSLGAAQKRRGILVNAVSMKKRRSSQNMIAMGLMAVLCVLSLLISNVRYTKDAVGLIAKKQDLLDYQEYVLSGEWLEKKGSIFDIQYDKENLNNSKREDSGVEVLEVTMSSRPYASLYLKGYHGTAYENATWTMDYSVFSDLCRQNDASSKEVAKTLFNSGYDQNTGTDEVPELEFEITYLNSWGNVAYTPYFTDYNSLDNKYTLTGDFVLDKSLGDGKISGVCINPMGNTWGMYTLADRIYGMEYLSEYSWYDAVLKEYLKVPEEMVSLFDDMHLDAALGRNNIYLDISVWSQQGTDVTEIAKNVRSYLRSAMRYSLDLDELPADMDPIEYALTESNEGYCMHFASAGTLILRYLGVPARYVSGYVVTAGSFQPEGDEYVAVVKDYNAHAWVEVFIDGLGWVPVEMTPGYENGTGTLPTETNKNESESQTQDSLESQIEESEEPQSESEESESEESENNETESEALESENESDTNESNITAPLGRDEGNGLGSNAFWEKIGPVLVMMVKILVGIAMAAVLILLLFMAGKRWIANYHRGLKKKLEKKHTRRAVKQIHRRMYGYLRIRKQIWKSVSDKELESLLIEAFPQVTEEGWAEYMEIVKKMYFSREDISEEEMMRCYECYQEVSREFFRD